MWGFESERCDMLRAESLEALLAPVSDVLPSGADLEYDPAFTALEAEVRPTAEQQFGDTVIPAVEPEWRVVSDHALALFQRTKDVRVAIQVVRASTRLQGTQGFSLGMTLLVDLLERFWDTVHPQLDADDDLDPTMRINALAPLVDSGMVLRDLHEAVVGTSRTVGAIRVRDIAIAYNKLAPKGDEPVRTLAQVEGALRDIHGTDPALLQAAIEAAGLVDRLDALVSDRTGRADLLDLKPLQTLTALVRQACRTANGMSADSATAQETSAGAPEQAGTPSSTTSSPQGDGEIRSRQDALRMLDKVIAFLEASEPGNPAPLLIQRAKRLVGVSFMQIMADLAPDAVSSIENITGKPPDE